ncbi:GIY-YIG nuclease family protein [Escherichia coli]|uniref:GIY-YIG nuclease family protein n=1 Tax=Escherichia coli TaxID=562 RepID=UPI000B3E856F|nr:GIY-YIG nuclease family protein [Escherichia coli]EFI2836373.1 GIY-YIG nuclease family protein [Escherichia coli]
MEIRSLSVIRFAKDIEFVRKGSRAIAPLEYEFRLIESKKTRYVTYHGFVGDWSGSKTKVLFRCKNDHWFYVTINDFFNNRGCAYCSGNKKRNNDVALYEVKQAAKKRGLGETVVGFDSGYKDAHTRNLVILCPEHGEYITTLASFLHSGNGCKQCGIIKAANKRRKTTDEALLEAEDAAKKRGRGEVVVCFDGGYDTIETKNLVILCPEHGEYITTLASFIRGYGCVLCAKYGFQLKKVGYFYIQKLIGRGVDGYKFGITNRDVYDRLRDQSRRSKLDHELVFSHRFDIGKNAAKVERMIKDKIKHELCFVSKELMPDGYTETISKEAFARILNDIKSICVSLS